MVAQLEISVAHAWIFAVLTTDPEITSLVGSHVFNSQITGTNPYPAVVYAVQSPMRPLRGVGGYKIWESGLFTIKAVGQTRDYDDITPIALRIDQLFDRTGGPGPNGGTVVSSMGETWVQYPESDNQSNDFRHLGRLYRLTVQGV
jgi:hypothetical protein